ncbi:MAG: hypothetical protein Q9226_009039, partial [Calogaya cf. arnoldii]
RVYETQLAKYALYTQIPYLLFNSTGSSTHTNQLKHNQLEVARILTNDKALHDMSVLLWRQRKVLAREDRGPRIVESLKTAPVKVVEDDRKQMEKIWQQNMLGLVGKARRWVNETAPIRIKASNYMDEAPLSISFHYPTGRQT